jgi:uncharacterized protein (DUF433 family)
LEPGSTAGLLVYENLWAAPFASAVRRSGGQLVASGRIPVQAILGALEAEIVAEEIVAEEIVAEEIEELEAAAEAEELSEK